MQFTYDERRKLGERKIRFKALLQCKLQNVSRKLCRIVLATTLRNKLHESLRSVTYPTTAKNVAKHVVKAVGKVESNSPLRATCLAIFKVVARYVTLRNVSCNLVSQRCRQNIARQVQSTKRCTV